MFQIVPNPLTMLEMDESDRRYSRDMDYDYGDYDDL